MRVFFLIFLTPFFSAFCLKNCLHILRSIYCLHLCFGRYTLRFLSGDCRHLNLPVYSTDAIAVMISRSTSIAEVSLILTAAVVEALLSRLFMYLLMAPVSYFLFMLHLHLCCYVNNVIITVFQPSCSSLERVYIKKDLM